MSETFKYSTDFYGINNESLKDCCVHLLCTAGEGSFVVNGSCYHVIKNDLVVFQHPDKIKNIANHPKMRVEWFAADHKFLLNCLPANNYSIGGSITLYKEPIIHLSVDNAQRFLDDIHRLRDGMERQDAIFYKEIMGSMCLTMMYDIFEFHALQYDTIEHTERAGYIVKELINLLRNGNSMKQREVSYYAQMLNVSPKYLSATVRRLTGNSVTYYIDYHTIPILIEMLNDERLSLTQIADRMNFNSLSYFSRYCTKHLGKNPREYRASLQPK